MQPSNPNDRPRRRILGGRPSRLPFATWAAMVAVGLAVAAPVTASAQSLGLGSSEGGAGEEVSVSLSFSGAGAYPLTPAAAVGSPPPAPYLPERTPRSLATHQGSRPILVRLFTEPYLPPV